jgi:hypothetical protein
MTLEGAAALPTLAAAAADRLALRRTGAGNRGVALFCARIALQSVSPKRHPLHNLFGVGTSVNRLVNRTITPVTEMRNGRRSTPACLLPRFVRADIDCSLIQPRSPWCTVSIPGVGLQRYAGGGFARQGPGVDHKRVWRRTQIVDGAVHKAWGHGTVVVLVDRIYLVAHLTNTREDIVLQANGGCHASACQDESPPRTVVIQKRVIYDVKILPWVRRTFLDVCEHAPVLVCRRLLDHITAYIGTTCVRQVEFVAWLTLAVVPTVPWGYWRTGYRWFRCLRPPCIESACLDPRLLDGTVRSRAEAPSLASANSLSNACPGHSPKQARHYLKPKCCLGNASVSRYFTVDAAASAPAPACQGVGWAPLGGRRQASSCRAEFGCSSYSYFEPILVGRGRRWRAWQAGAASLVVAWPAMLPSRALPALTSHRLRARRHRLPPFYENRLLRPSLSRSVVH